MGSKYDAFWRARTEAVAELMDRAAAGEAAEMDVSDIRHLGNRGSWYGIARLRADGTVDGQMAHMVALARLFLGRDLPLFDTSPIAFDPGACWQQTSGSAAPNP